jgi:hypothetical protein
VPLATRLHVVKYGSSAERSRQGPFVRGRDVDVCVRRQPLLDQPRERIKPRYPCSFSVWPSFDASSARLRNVIDSSYTFSGTPIIVYPSEVTGRRPCPHWLSPMTYPGTTDGSPESVGKNGGALSSRTSRRRLPARDRSFLAQLTHLGERLTRSGPLG